MREMVLNHASLSAPDQRLAVMWLQDTVAGMATLVLNKVTEPTLRMRRSHYETPCSAGVSLADILQQLQKTGAREEYLFFLRLSMKVPLLSEVEQGIEHRFRLCEAVGCESKTLPPEDGEPLVMCAISDGIAVGFPSEQIWRQDQVTVNFIEMPPDGHIEEVSESIDNLTQSDHAQLINARYRSVLRKVSSPAALWEARETTFPNLTFGPDVEIHLDDLDRALLRTVVSKLVSLDEAASMWRQIGGPVPRWSCKVTTESASVLQSQKLSEARRFRSCRGTRELFIWHARFGSRGRIHLRFDAQTWEVEIGYVGPHLPL